MMVVKEFHFRIWLISPEYYDGILSVSLTQQIGHQCSDFPSIEVHYEVEPNNNLIPL